MMKPSSWIITLECNLNTSINAVANGEVDIKAIRELLVKIGTKGGAMKVTKCFDKGMD